MAAKKSYNKAFKEDALRLAEKSGVTQVASDLGIHPNMIYTWKRQLAGNGSKVFPGNSNPVDPELSQLKKDNARLKMEVEILKKAASIFLTAQRKILIDHAIGGEIPCSNCM